MKKFFTAKDFFRGDFFEENLPLTVRELCANMANDKLQKQVVELKMNYSSDKGWHSTRGIEPTHVWTILHTDEIDSLESLLKKLINIGPSSYASDDAIKIIERAKKLLESQND